ncbi:LytR/AlgR family response regulator transcription factor [Acanthopleuribacter pedis]|uniref:Response regulator transcription factor n=1 Tax=Acanthopleuribacter pedis TaxID=442870 RepID=A0A8J7Q9J3_9BACT|nr:LytTR family DNA-binding domain-containing protein [Acanthopleuribacter pedis]MBO1319459.1 response regulator transcription factor [Acanthopleuribacter pedis]
MLLKALIVDDEPLAHEVLLGYLEEVAFLEPVGHCYSAAEAMDVLGRTQVDLLFLDIHMPKLKGTDFLKILPHPPLTIITTAYAEYALEGFELDVCDYLVKPIRFDRFLKAVHKARARVQSGTAEPTTDKEPTSLPEAAEPAALFIKVDKKLVQLAPADITYLEAYGNYVKVWCGDQYLLTPRTLASFAAQLNGDQFLRIHKSYLVQKQHIRYLEAGMVVMNNGSQLPLGKTYKHLIKSLESQ